MKCMNPSCGTECGPIPGTVYVYQCPTCGLGFSGGAFGYLWYDKTYGHRNEQAGTASDAPWPPDGELPRARRHRPAEEKKDAPRFWVDPALPKRIENLKP